MSLTAVPPRKTRPHKPRQYAIRTELARLVDALFDLADTHKHRDVAIALAAYKEARLLADVAVKATLVSPDAARSVQTALAKIENRVRVQQALERRRPQAITMVPANGAEHE